MIYYLIDTETTGFSHTIHEITQISIIRYSDRHQINYFIRALYPDRTNPDALEKTGRVLADILKGGSRAEAVAGCNKFLEEDGQTPEHRCMIAHNASFDRRFCYALWENQKQVFPANCWLDTMPAVKNYMTLQLGLEKPKKSLHEAMKNCGLTPRAGAHSAVSDTQNLYLLHNHLVKQGVDMLPYIKREPQVEISTEGKEDE